MESMEKTSKIKSCINCIHSVRDETFVLYCDKSEHKKIVEGFWEYTACENDFEPDECYTGDL